METNYTQREVRRALALTGTLGAILLLMLLLAWLARTPLMNVISGPGVKALDARVLTSLRRVATPAIDEVFVVAAALGSPIAIVIVALAGLIILFARVRLTILVAWAAALGGSGILSVSLKHIFQRARPPGAAEFLHDTSFSFPSTHTVASLVAYGTVCYLLCRYVVQSRSRRALVMLGCALLFAMVASSRVVLGVHYLSDVSAGIVVGASWLVACLGALEIDRRGGNHSVH